MEQRILRTASLLEGGSCILLCPFLSLFSLMLLWVRRAVGAGLPITYLRVLILCNKSPLFGRKAVDTVAGVCSVRVRVARFVTILLRNHLHSLEEVFHSQNQLRCVLDALYLRESVLPTADKDMRVTTVYRQRPPDTGGSSQTCRHGL